MGVPFEADRSRGRESGERSRHGFNCQCEVVGHVPPTHEQFELRSSKPLGHFKNERRNPRHSALL